MNEYDPKPKHVLPLDYGRPQSKNKQKSVGSFIAGIFAGLGLAIGTPIIFLSNLRSNLGPAILLSGIVVVIALSVGAALKGYRSFARGLICSLLLIAALIILIIGICSGKFR
jgi:uncharacterized membrane protein YccC